MERDRYLGSDCRSGSVRIERERIDGSAVDYDELIPTPDAFRPGSQVSQLISTLTTASPPSSITSSFQDESHFQGDPELVDLAVPHTCFLLDHMKAGYTAQGLVCARKAFLDCSIEAGLV
jgi:hypothetical protein